VSVIESIADTLLSETFTRKFQSTEALIFLCVVLIVSNFFEISPLDYASLSAQKQ